MTNATHKQQTHQHIAPERPETKSKPVNDEISPDQADIFITARQPDIPAPQRLGSHDRGVDPYHPGEGKAEEVEEIERHTGGSEVMET